MSYILDALRKADRDRVLGEVPDLEAAHWGLRRPERSWRWLWIVVVLLVFNAGLLVYMLSRNAELPVEVSHPPTVRNVPALSPAAPVSRGPAAVVQESPQPSPRILRPKVAVQPHVAPVPAAVPKVQGAPAARVVTASAPLTAAPDSNTSDLPEWGELPLEFRSQFVLPHIDVYVYAEEPQRRFILVDLKKFREGDTLANGAVLEKITPAYLQLKYQDTRFRLDR